MPDHRTNKSIAERLDIQFNRRGHPQRRVWRAVLLASVVAPLLFLGFYAIRGDGTPYWSAPLSPGHEKLSENCGACHTQLGQPLTRLVTGNPHARSVLDENCQVCHSSQHSDDHHDNMHPATLQNCAVCHREHRRGTGLTEVADHACTHCHANLEVGRGEFNFVRHVRSWAEHPEFAARRKVSTGSSAMPGPEHGIHKLAEFSEDRWTDKTRLRFNHQVHLQDEGVLMPWDPSNPDASQTRKKLACNDCHEPDSSGAYMEPVTYESCQNCHPLRFGPLLTDIGREPLPHIALAAVLVEARRRLARTADQEFAAARANQDVEKDSLVPRLPNKRASQPPDTQDRKAWVDDYLARHESNVVRSVKHGCQQCHYLAPSESDTARALAQRVEPPNMPKRWMPHSHFNHGRHDAYACVVCHNADFADDDNEKLLRADAKIDASNPAHRLNSRSTDDILMPSIRVCQKCHGDVPGVSRWEATAKSDCVHCHRYHHGQRRH